MDLAGLANPKKKKTLLLASVLKPVDDTRMYEKFAVSLRGQYEVHVVGFRAGFSSQEENGTLHVEEEIRFHPLFSFQRNTLQRWSSSVRFFQKLVELKPDCVVVHAVELLPVSIFYKTLVGGKLIYDIRENYARNIRCQNNYPNWMKPILAAVVNGIQWFSRLSANQYILAEKTYLQELPFLPKQKVTVLENRFPRWLLPPKTDEKPISRRKEANVRLLYSGTISEVYGVREAVGLAKKLHKLDSRITLTIIGRVTSSGLQGWIEKELSESLWANLLISQTPIAHSLILEQMQHADFALLPYRPNPSTENCIPTKLYECLALQTPMLVQHNPVWEKKCQPHQAAIFLDFQNFDPKEVLRKIKGNDFFTTESNGEIYWEERKLRKLMAEMF